MAANRAFFISVAMACRSSRLGIGAAVSSWDAGERLGLLLAEHVACVWRPVWRLCGGHCFFLLGPKQIRISIA